MLESGPAAVHRAAVRSETEARAGVRCTPKPVTSYNIATMTGKFRIISASLLCV
jgi:hypothetical protein